MGIAQFDVNRVVLNNTERTKYFDKIGVNVQSASNLDQAIQMSGLDFSVEKMPMAFLTECMDADTGKMLQMPHSVPDQYVTVRSDTLEPLGVVGKNYNILQNREAFDFLDNIVGAGMAKFETAGSYGDGAKSFITISTESTNILGDKYTPYILLMNSFDGSGSVRAMFTPIRIFCSNCLERAIKGATDKVSIRHSNSLQERLAGARTMLAEHAGYLGEFKKEAEALAVKQFSAKDFGLLVDELFPINTEDKEIIQVRQTALRENLMTAYNQDDLQNFNGTAWKVVQAIADFESHKPMFRATKSMALANINSVIQGMPMLNNITDRMLAL